MTDIELATFLGIQNDPRWSLAIARLVPAKRAAYERMANLCNELRLWQDGLGPMPAGIIVCWERRR